MKNLILMIQFMTRIPIPIQIEANESDFSKGIIFFPMVGLIIGAILYGVYVCISPIFSVELTAIFLCALEIVLTGGLHLDGLADTFDGLYSNRDRERMLEIMKDSRIGSNGVLILLMYFFVKYGCLLALERQQMMMAIIFMPILSRTAVVWACKFSKYARETGMGHFFIGKVSWWQLGVVTLQMALMGMLIGLSYLWLCLPVGLFTLIFTKHCHRKIGGMTGDTIGALSELCSIIFLISVVTIK